MALGLQKIFPACIDSFRMRPAHPKDRKEGEQIRIHAHIVVAMVIPRICPSAIKFQHIFQAGFAKIKLHDLLRGLRILQIHPMVIRVLMDIGHRICRRLVQYLKDILRCIDPVQELLYLQQVGIPGKDIKLYVLRGRHFLKCRI